MLTHLPYKHYVALLLFCFFLHPSHINASSLDIRSSLESKLDFSLVIQQNQLGLSGLTETLDVDILGLGFQVFDIPKHLPIHIGIAGGYAFVDLPTYTILDDRDFSGAYLTLIARGELFKTSSFALQITASYDYLAVETNSDTQSTRFRWNHFKANLGLNYFFTHFLSTTFGATFGQIDAKLTGSGDNNLYLKLETSSQTAGYVSLNYHVAENQRVTLKLQQGYSDDIMIQFQRVF